MYQCPRNISKNFRKIYNLEPKILNILINCWQTDTLTHWHTHRCRSRADPTRDGSAKKVTFFSHKEQRVMNPYTFLVCYLLLPITKILPSLHLTFFHLPSFHTFCQVGFHFINRLSLEIWKLSPPRIKYVFKKILH